MSNTKKLEQLKKASKGVIIQSLYLDIIPYK